MEFSSWGINHSYVDGNVDLGRVAYNMWNGFPHITSGVKKNAKVGHAWIWEGIRCNVSSINHSNGKIQISGSPLLYCNWGWGGSSNGWFANYEDAVVNGEIRRYIDDNRQIYITGTSYSFP